MSLLATIKMTGYWLILLPILYGIGPFFMGFAIGGMRRSRQWERTLSDAFDEKWEDAKRRRAR